MNYQQLGRSGLLVSSLCLGTMIFGEESERGTPPAEAERIISRFLDAGGNFLDTADIYASGRSEEIVGQAIKGKRDQIVLATKVHFSPQKGPNEVACLAITFCTPSMPVCAGCKRTTLTCITCTP